MKTQNNNNKNKHGHSEMISYYCTALNRKWLNKKINRSKRKMYSEEDEQILRNHPLWI